MSFPRYPEHKDSGIDWLGKVPVHWKLRKIAWHIPYSVGWTPPSGREEYYDGDYLWVTIADLNKPVIYDTRSKITQKAVADRGGKLSPAGSMLFSFKLTVGNVSFLGEPAYTNEAIASFEPNEQIDLKYWRYAAPQFIPRFGRENIYGALLLNQEMIGSVRFYAPDIQEQNLISKFLDHETARIDALVEEQQRLIKLLKEKRQAVISHAVTKGLDHDVPMKDSGVEWLGEVPAHWRVASLKHAFEVVADVDHYMPSSVDSGVPYVMTGDLRRLASEIDMGSCKQITREEFLKLSRKIRTSKGDVIMARYATIGSVSYVDIDAEFIVSYSCVTIRPQAELASGIYLFLYFQSDAFIKGISNMINANTQENVGIGDLKEVKAALPNVHEQKVIVHELELKLTELDRIIKTSRATIRLLIERRAVLISAAVTGKIDVRGWQPPTGSSALAENSQMETV